MSKELPLEIRDLGPIHSYPANVSSNAKLDACQEIGKLTYSTIWLRGNDLTRSQGLVRIDQQKATSGGNDANLQAQLNGVRRQQGKPDAGTSIAAVLIDGSLRDSDVVRQDKENLRQYIAHVVRAAFNVSVRSGRQQLVCRRGGSDKGQIVKAW
jgi:hypothetical protein